jgi:hypothetical protein
MKLFKDEEFAIIEARNKEDLGELQHLTDSEITQLKVGGNISLGLVVRARAILAAHYDGKLMTGGYVTRSELNLIIEEHNNLATKMMLIFEALVRRKLITEKELFDIAAEMRGDTPPTKSKPKKKGSR